MGEVPQRLMVEMLNSIIDIIMFIHFCLYSAYIEAASRPKIWTCGYVNILYPMCSMYLSTFTFKITQMSVNIHRRSRSQPGPGRHVADDRCCLADEC